MKPLAIGTSVSGRYKLKKFKKTKSGKPYDVIETPWFDNLITNGGLNRMFTDNTWVSTVVVGTGNSTPAITNTALDSFLVESINMSQIYTDAVEYEPDKWYYRWRKQAQFGEGVAEGNLQEVGINSTDNTLISRALIVDGAGDPTTLTILSNEFLTVTYEVRRYPNLTDQTGTIVFTGSKGGSYDYTIRPSALGGAASYGSGTVSAIHSNYCYGYSYDAHIGTIEQSPTGQDQTLNSYDISEQSYVTDSYQRDIDLFFDITHGNDVSHGLQCVKTRIGGIFWQIEFDPYIPKRNTDELTITLRVSVTRKTL